SGGNDLAVGLEAEGVDCSYGAEVEEAAARVVNVGCHHPVVAEPHLDRIEDCGDGRGDVVDGDRRGRGGLLRREQQALGNVQASAAGGDEGADEGPARAVIAQDAVVEVQRDVKVPIWAKGQVHREG